MTPKKPKSALWSWDDDRHPGFATQVYAFMGRRGSGKTYGAGVLAEDLLDEQVQVIVVDPVGNWWGLRASSDGRAAGYDIPVLGGSHGDLALPPTAGVVVADSLVQTGSSAVLAISEMRKGERKRFLTDFADQLFHKKKTSRDVCHVFLEEAHTVLPQKTFGPDDAKMLGALEDLVRLGRNYGIGVTMIDQRPQSVSKDALNQAECLAVFQLIGPQERDAIKKWTESKEAAMGELGALSTLPQGECFLWSPQWLAITERVRFRTKKTYDASGTPKAGDKNRLDVDATVSMKTLNLGDLETKMLAAAKEQADNDPKELKKKLVKLDTELRTARAVAERLQGEVAEAKLTASNSEIIGKNDDKIHELSRRTIEDLGRRIEKLQLTEQCNLEQMRQIRAAYAHVENHLTGHVVVATAATIGNAIVELGRRLADLRTVVMSGWSDNRFRDPVLNNRAAWEMTQFGHPPMPETTPKIAVGSTALREAPSEGYVTTPRATNGSDPILVALKQLAKPLSTRQLAIFCGRADRTIRNRLTELRQFGYVTTESDVHTLTAAGARAAGPVGRANIATRIDLWRGQLDSTSRKVFDLLLAQRKHGSSAGLSTETIASNLLLAGRTVRNALTPLSTAGLVIRGKVNTLNPDLFMEA